MPSHNMKLMFALCLQRVMLRYSVINTTLLELRDSPTLDYEWPITNITHNAVMSASKMAHSAGEYSVIYYYKCCYRQFTLLLILVSVEGLDKLLLLVLFF